MSYPYVSSVFSEHWRRIARAFLYVCLSMGIGQVHAFAQDQYAALRLVPHKSRPGGSQGAVVFVHGMWGDGQGTWTNTAAGTSWPTILSEDPSFAGWDSYVSDYDSALTRGFSVPGAAQNLMNAIREQKLLDKPQIIFVCHSLGGVIVRRMIEMNPDLQPKIRFIAFFGTPTEGSQLATVVRELVGGNSQYEAMLPTASGNDLLELVNSTWVRSQFRLIRSFCGYERDPYQLGRLDTVKVVRRSSAASLCTDDAVEVAGDHSKIVKPDGRGETQTSRNNAHSFLRGWLLATTPKVDTPVQAEYLFESDPMTNGAPVETRATLKEISIKSDGSTGPSHVYKRRLLNVFDGGSLRCLWTEEQPKLSDAVTVAAWVFPNESESKLEQSIIAIQASGPDGRFELRRNDATFAGPDMANFIVRTLSPSGTIVEVPSPAIGLQNKRWTLVVASYDEKTHKVCISTDGAPLSDRCNTNKYSGPLFVVPAGKVTHFTIGCKGQGGLGPQNSPLARTEFNGTITRAQVYKGVLSDSEVKSLFTEGLRVILH